LDSLESTMRMSVVNITLQTGQSCVNSIKRLVCAQVYLPCYPGGIKSTFHSV
jgi:hypothetical protein